MFLKVDGALIFISNMSKIFRLNVCLNLLLKKRLFLINDTYIVWLPAPEWPEQPEIAHGYLAILARRTLLSHALFDVDVIASMSFPFLNSFSSYPMYNIFSFCCSNYSICRSTIVVSWDMVYICWRVFGCISTWWDSSSYFVDISSPAL